MEVKVLIDNEIIKICANDYSTSYIYENSRRGEYSFCSPACYGLIGKSGSGNWALSNLLTGRKKLRGGKITADGSDISPWELRNISCYIGHEHCGGFMPFHRHETVRKAVESGIRKTHKDTFQNIINKFELSPERFDRKFKQTGNEHWRASLAIGYAYGKKIYCTPFLESSLWENYYSIMLEKWLNILKDEDSIIIITTDDDKYINGLIDKAYYF